MEEKRGRFGGFVVGALLSLVWMGSGFKVRGLDGGEGTGQEAGCGVVGRWPVYGGVPGSVDGGSGG